MVIISKGGDILGLVGPGLYEDRRSVDFFIFYSKVSRRLWDVFSFGMFLVMLKTTRLFFMLGCCEIRIVHKYGIFSFMQFWSVRREMTGILRASSSLFLYYLFMH